jgi:hypothetical protein
MLIGIVALLGFGIWLTIYLNKHKERPGQYYQQQYPGYPQQPGYPQAYPQQPGYPQAYQQQAYPQPGYQYPPQQPGYPQQGQYPPHQ